MKGLERRSYLYVAFATTLNIVLYALSGGRYLYLEGRVRADLFRNWCRRFAYRPVRFMQPATEAELVTLVRNSAGIRVCGAGHSFNDGIVADQVLVSLDRLRGMLWRDLTTMRAAFRGGTRVRDISRTLYSCGAAIGALPSHDAQSIAGIISTDVHGTGRDWGFVSRWVERIRLIDASGEIHTLEPSDELFKAAIGGIGAVGIISEVVLRAVPRFNVEQRVQMSTLTAVKENFDRLFQQHRHLSLYLFPFTDRCQVNTWNPTERPRSLLGPLREFLSISTDALLSAWVGGLLADTGLLPRLSTLAHSFKRGTDLVLESYKAFNRTIYPLHQELEFTVPFERAFELCHRLIKLYERIYREGRLPYTLVEVRFTPAGHDRTLVGAGRERRSAWINLCCNDSGRFEAYYAAAEALIRDEGGAARPHLGKYCFSLGREDMQRAHPETFPRFLRLVNESDPTGKLSNDLTRRIFRD
jgi:FAD/FMN-containing dehydrogenase